MPHKTHTTPQAEWKDWLTRLALPLWSTTGYDRTRHLYHERLTLEGAPIALPHLRLMVQARQIATYCRAALDGVFDATHEALTCLHTVRARYWQVDGQPGWVFALGPDGEPSSTLRDLYAHAFILYAHAWAYRLSEDTTLLAVARQTTLEIEQIFAAPHGGYLDTAPPQDILRRQNPHMHLLEAYLALFEVTADSFYLERAHGLMTLAQTRFMPTHPGMLLELFKTDWSPLHAFGQNTVEPGHLFEWSWLLRDYMRLAPANTSDQHDLKTLCDSLLQAGLRYGTSQAAVFDSITDNGTPVTTSTRIWPQTELMRLLADRQQDLGSTPQAKSEATLLDNLTQVFFTTYAPPSLQGGWIDRYTAHGRIAVDHMPASSLYHIYGVGRLCCALENHEEITSRKSGSTLPKKSHDLF